MGCQRFDLWYPLIRILGLIQRQYQCLCSLLAESFSVLYSIMQAFLYWRHYQHPSNVQFLSQYIPVAHTFYSYKLRYVGINGKGYQPMAPDQLDNMQFDGLVILSSLSSSDEVAYFPSYWFALVKRSMMTCYRQ